MKILLIRHAEPDYARDSLTEKGWREAELLSQRLAGLDIRDIYCSPLGRARDTASLTLADRVSRQGRRPVQRSTQNFLEPDAAILDALPRAIRQGPLAGP